MIAGLSCDLYNNNINMEFLNKTEVIKQYRQSVMNSENVDFFGSVIGNLQELKIMTLVIVYKNILEFLYEYFYYPRLLISLF